MTTQPVRRCQRSGLTQQQVHCLASIAINGERDPLIPFGVERSLIIRGMLQYGPELTDRGWDALAKTELLSASFRSSLMRCRAND